MTPQQIEQVREALRVIAKRICGSDCKARYMDVRKEDQSTHCNPRPGARCATCIAKDALALLDPVASEPKPDKGADLISAERQRQISVEGRTQEHDAQHGSFEISRAALCYMEAAVYHNLYAPGDPSTRWPWEAAWWKPSEDPIRNLVKAGALIAAEIDRLQGGAVPPAKCKECKGKGVVADYIGLEMRCVGVDCPTCNGTGVVQ